MNEKILYRIGEVSNKLGVETHVLRYWEKEIPFLKPSMRGKGGQRLYTEEDVEKFALVKKMLYEDGMRIEGVKRYFRREEKNFHDISRIKNILIEAKQLLEKI